MSSEVTTLQVPTVSLPSALRAIFGFIHKLAPQRIRACVSGRNELCRRFPARPWGRGKPRGLLLETPRSALSRCCVPAARPSWRPSSAVFFFLFFFLIITLFIYFWLCWVFIASRGLSVVAASGGYSSLRCAGFSLRWLLLLRSMGSRCAGFSSCGMRAQ